MGVRYDYGVRKKRCEDRLGSKGIAEDACQERRLPYPGVFVEIVFVTMDEIGRMN